MLQGGVDVAVDPDRVVQQQVAVAAYADQIAQPPLPYPLAHRGAAEHHRLDAEETRIGCQVDLQPPVHGALVEQDRLLRQPFQRGAGLDCQVRPHLGRGSAARAR